MDIIDKWEKKVVDGNDFYYDEVTVRIVPVDTEKVEIRVDGEVYRTTYTSLKKLLAVIQLIK